MLNIGLLFGGKSTEHDISILTMFQVKEKIESNYNIYSIYISKSGDLYLANDVTLDDFKDNNLNKLRKIEWIKKGFKRSFKKVLIDSMLILNHGMNGEDGMSSALMEFYDIPYVGSDMYASSIALDKATSDLILRNYNVPIVKKQIYTKSDFQNKIPIVFDKCIIKPARLGSSIGINIAKNKEEIDSNLIEAFKYDEKVVIEELLEDFEEYNIALYKTDSFHFSYSEEVKKEHEFLDFDDKYITRIKENTHKKVTDVKLNILLKDISKKVYDIFNLSGIVRIDFMFSNNVLYFNEVNTIPGALSNYLFDDFEDDIEKLIKHSIVLKKKKEMLLKSYSSNLLNMSSIKK